jgi:AraC-like DNA-binding protein
MTPNVSQSLSLRSYGAEGGVHAHDHVQIVLPVVGTLDIEAGGRGGRLETACGIFIAPGTLHCQSAAGENRFLVVDCDMSQIDEACIDDWLRQPFLRIPEAARRLIQFIDLSVRRDMQGDSLTAHALPLLLGALTESAAPSVSPFVSLLCCIECAIDEAWPVSRMAQMAGLSASRLHAVFLSELQTTPQKWLAQLRVERAQRMLAESDLPIAELALHVGYSDQTALTRAMQRMAHVTPAAYRRLHR